MKIISPIIVIQKELNKTESIFATIKNAHTIMDVDALFQIKIMLKNKKMAQKKKPPSRQNVTDRGNGGYHDQIFYHYYYHKYKNCY